jgi:hypothetical protein
LSGVNWYQSFSTFLRRVLRQFRWLVVVVGRFHEEAPHRDHNVQDVMIEDLQRQIAELTQRLEALEVGIREMENSDSDSTFDNPYHNPAPYREQRGRDKEFVDEEVQDEEFIHGDVHDDVEHEYVKDPSQGFRELGFSTNL